MKNRKCYKCQSIRPLNDKNFASAPIANQCNSGFSWACLNCLGADTLALDGGFGVGAEEKGGKREAN